MMKRAKELKVVPDATRLAEEPGSSEEVARLAAAWFTKYLVHRRNHTGGMERAAEQWLMRDRATRR